MNRFVEVVVSCKQKFSADFRRQLKLITSSLGISLTKTEFVTTAGRVLKFSLCWLAQPPRRLLKFLPSSVVENQERRTNHLKPKRTGFAKFTFDVLM